MKRDMRSVRYRKRQERELEDVYGSLPDEFKGTSRNKKKNILDARDRKRRADEDGRP